MGVSTEELANRAAVIESLKTYSQTIAVKKQGVVDRVLANELAFSYTKANLFEDAIKKAFKGNQVNPSKYALSKHTEPKDRIFNLLISYLHIGANLTEDEVGNTYGPIEERRRLAAVVRQAIEYKRQYREQTVLRVHILGDVIHGVIHEPEGSATLTNQAGRAIRYLTAMLEAFSSHFPKVEVSCLPGNHGRNPLKHPVHAYSQKSDSFENMIYDSVKVATQKLPNVFIAIPTNQYYTCSMFGKTAIFAHGDGALRIGSPGKAINTELASTIVNKYNSKVGDSSQKVFLACIGHTHVASMFMLGCGATFITNGALVPPDAFAIGINQPHNVNGQWLFESTREHIVGDNRFITIDDKVDGDKSLDTIIPACKQ